MYNEQELRVDDVLCQEKWKEGIEHSLALVRDSKEGMDR
jgi:hypothetical protein